MSLHDNWNIISVPFNESLHKTEIIVKNNSFNYNWADAVNQGIILDFFYNWNSSSQSYDIANVLEPGLGYWTWAYYDCEFLLARNRDDDDYITDLNMNWNLMGTPYNTSINKHDLVVRYNNTNYSWYEATTNNNEEGEPLILDFIYKWNSNTQNYILTDTIYTGDGYWMYAYYNCTILRT